MGHRLSKIYTRTGDGGTTGLGDGSRVDKDASRVQAMGDVDELDARLLGGTLSEASRTALVDYLATVPLRGPGAVPDGVARAREAVHLLVVSPEFAVQK